MVAIIIGHGANDFEIPCMVFENVELASKFLTEVFGLPNITRKGEEWWGSYNEDEMGELSEQHIFESYYGGCGGIDYYTIRVVNFGQKICGFSLD